ncbi:MAG: methyltransferase domain-containing protein [Burkholderiales bacterium]
MDTKGALAAPVASARFDADGGQEGLLANVRANLAPAPNPALAVARYRTLARGYDATCTRILGIRASAVAALRLRGGEHVADVACGTGATLIALAEAVGPRGRVCGIDISPEMVAIARRRVADAGLSHRVSVFEGGADKLRDLAPIDAFLLCYTHDLLQSAESVAAMHAAARPGARIVVAGMRWLPWWWGFAPNLVTAFRARRYLTTYRGLRRPWRYLRDRVPDFRIIATDHLGTSYLGQGAFASHSNSIPDLKETTP